MRVDGDVALNQVVVQVGVLGTRLVGIALRLLDAMIQSLVFVLLFMFLVQFHFFVCVFFCV